MNPTQTNNLPGQGNGEFVPLSKPRLSLSRLAFYFITLAALGLIYVKFSEIELVEGFFVKSNYFWLIGIVVTQVLSYYFIALNFREVLRMKELEVSVKELFPVTFVVQFINQALPSAGFSGQAFFIQYLRKFGLSVAEGISRAILELTTLFMAFGSFFIVSVFLMFRGDVVSKHPETKFLIYLFSLFAIIGLFLFFIFQKKGRGRIARWTIDKLHNYFENRKKKNGGSDRSKHVAMVFDQLKSSLSLTLLRKKAREFRLAYFWQVMVFFANILSLYFITLAIDFPISFSASFIAFTLTKFISMISFVPGALGVFEGVMTLILVTFGMPAEAAFAATLLLRAFTFWLPMPVGWILYRWILNKQELAN